jgi:hypothetical protein
VLRQKGVTLRATCDESCSLRATGVITVAKPRASLTLRAAETRLSRAGQRTLRLGLPSAARSRLADLLAGKGQATAALTLSALDADGNRSVATTKVIVRR